ncbi:hypothetical protein SRHO_G00286090 [Serrasalmus rhombeus]
MAPSCLAASSLVSSHDTPACNQASLDQLHHWAIPFQLQPPVGPPLLSLIIPSRPLFSTAHLCLRVHHSPPAQHRTTHSTLLHFSLSLLRRWYPWCSVLATLHGHDSSTSMAKLAGAYSSTLTVQLA